VDVLNLATNGRMVLVVVSSLPNTHRSVCIAHFVEDTVATKNDEVVFALDLEGLDVWIVDHYVWVSFKGWNLGFWISESSSN
jgi:hypothetical protein